MAFILWHSLWHSVLEVSVQPVRGFHVVLASHSRVPNLNKSSILTSYFLRCILILLIVYAGPERLVVDSVKLLKTHCFHCCLIYLKLEVLSCRYFIALFRLFNCRLGGGLSSYDSSGRQRYSCLG